LWYPLALFSIKYFRKFTDLIGTSMFPLLSWTFEVFGDNYVSFYGEEIDEKALRNLVLVNHQFYCDWLIGFVLGYRTNKHGYLKIVMKKSIEYIPGVGTAIKHMGFLYVSRNWESDKKTMAKSFYWLKAAKEPFWLLSHPEGSRLTPDKLEASQKFAKERNLPVLNNILLPRLKGFLASAQNLREDLDGIIDLTVVYKTKPPNFMSLFFGLGRSTNVDVLVRRFPIVELPKSDADIERWLITKYQEKDEIIAHHKKHGVFPNNPKEIHPRAKDTWHTLEFFLGTTVWFALYCPPLYIYYLSWQYLRAWF
jgi:1-acyl-sn-glycerol-3-phosphate acyltransferase